MGMQQFNVSALKDFDNGALAAMLEKCVADAIADCRDRGHLTKARSVKLELSFVPMPPDRTGEVYAINMAYTITPSIPPTTVKALNMQVNRNNSALFNNLSLDNAAQTTLPIEDPPLA